MTTIIYSSAAEYKEAFASGSAGALVPYKLAGEILGLSRTRLNAIVTEGDELVLIKVETDDSSIRGFTEASVRALLAKREARAEKLAATTEESVKRHIIDSLLANGFADDSSRLLHYGDHVMKPFGLSHQIARDREHIGFLLGEVSRETWADPDCNALLSAVVINKTGAQRGKPSEGFWTLVEAVTGKVIKESARDAYWAGEITKLQKYVRNLAAL